MSRKPRRWYQSLVDWLGLFTAVTAIIWVVMWATTPDSQEVTAQMAVIRTLSYSIPISSGMWGVARITRRGSDVPEWIAAVIPYISLNKDGSMAGQTAQDAKAGKGPVPLHGSSASPATPVEEGGSDGQDNQA